MEDQVSGLGDEGEVVGVVFSSIGVEDHVFIKVGNCIGCPDLLMVVSVELILGLLMG
jgi:UPF0716 family protein affecting phage T7 exclusion